jgi:uncharacterized cupin superfamily protein
MVIVHHAHLGSDYRDGEHRVTAADRRLGIDAFEVWLCTLEPGCSGAELRHQGEAVVLALAGGGKLLLDGGPLRFQSPCTLCLPPGRPFRFVNSGLVNLRLVAVWTDAPRQAPAHGVAPI